MDVTRIRLLLVVAIALLVVSELGNWVAEAVDTSMGVVAGAVAAALYAVCGYRAKTASSEGAQAFWIWLPTGTLSLVPVALRIWLVLDRPAASGLEKTLALLPMAVSFVLPVTLLLVVYGALGANHRPPLGSSPP